jgi:deoxycytidine triphosphate deaminase
MQALNTFTINLQNGAYMILSTKTILALNKKCKPPLIENLSEREASNAEGVGMDLRVGEVYKLEGEGFLGVSDRKTPDERKIADIKEGAKEVILEPGDYVLVKTMEKVNIPSEKIAIEEGAVPAYIMVDVHPRSTLQRCGIYFMGTKTDPGYSGELVFALTNLSKSTFRLELGARIANITFEQVAGDIVRAYEGQWKGGRVSAKKVEKQN